ncbi:F-box domain containing protein [Pyrenophora tritici-repentis Pt-1C-BFP]|uniref:F-box domain containing protein n=1 Tax=Pyrenophora tritici-repentis (strain Pt-1C-BFP) TaxID=426418 RepID=B2WLZ5_PYRTR|nr:F-box domain containing protein [Pyrenophora tritici-repentis Pt-1C-BFP]EDU44055.1 F-box domain containing protein [Pyrenophora tritici-repentis Pt-1C-BFP]
MGFFKRFRRHKSPKKNESRTRNDLYAAATYDYHGPDQTQRLPDKVLRRIFEEVCPHSADETLDGSEDSGNDGCMSCDMRDLAHCALTKRQWYGVAAGLLYNSIRIDAVHYCELEEVYADQRRRKSRNGEEVDAPTLRLQQLCQSVRGNQYLGQRVRFIKLPYMTREACKADLARTVSGCPNLEFIDLPDGFYNGDASCQLLRQELQARCPHIKSMKYNEGAEQSFETLLQGYWQELISVQLNKIQMEPSILRQALSMLPYLKELTIIGVSWLNDSTFHDTPGLPNFPALETLRLEKTHSITANGLAQYLYNPMCSARLRTLTLKNVSSILVSSLHTVLQAAVNLKTLEYTITVSASLPLDPIPPMTSYTLHKLNFEIISSNTNQMYPPAASHYQYLAKSLMSNCLPALRQLYVRDPDFPEILTLAPPVRPFSEAPPPMFNQPLEVYSKGLDELEWIFTSIIPPEGHGRRPSISGGRPVSSYSAHKGLGPQWGGDARKSIVVPNGFGGFLAVPADNDGRPRSAGHMAPPGGFGHVHSNSLGGSPRASWITHAGREKRASRADLWR